MLQRRKDLPPTIRGFTTCCTNQRVQPGSTQLDHPLVHFIHSSIQGTRNSESNVDQGRPFSLLHLFTAYDFRCYYSLYGTTLNFVALREHLALAG